MYSYTAGMYKNNTYTHSVHTTTHPGYTRKYMENTTVK